MGKEEDTKKRGGLLRTTKKEGKKTEDSG